MKNKKETHRIILKNLLASFLELILIYFVPICFGFFNSLRLIVEQGSCEFRALATICEGVR